MNRIRLKPKNPNNKILKAYSQAVKTGAKSLHIIKTENGWAVKKIRNKRASRVFNTQKKAIDYARGKHCIEGINMYIHK